MFYVSNILTTPPSTFSTPLQELVYESLAQLNIPFERVDTDPGITMEDCQNIDKVLGGTIVKTVFLCNRQQTLFYIYAMRADKPFVTKDFGAALGIPRVSFGSTELLNQIAGVEHGATTILSCCLHVEANVRFVIDRELVEADYYCCSDGTTTCFLKLRSDDLLRFVRSTGHEPELI